MNTRRIDLPGRGLSLEVAEAGEGGRPLLLVHGFTGAKEDFTDWLDRLAALGWHAVAPDQRGHGRSDQPDDEEMYSLAAFSDDLDALADALGWERFTLLGHSMGGMVAQAYALSPAAWRLDGLILMDTGHGRLEGIDPSAVEKGAAIVRDGGLQLLAEILRNVPDPLSTPADQRLRRERPGYAEFGEAKLVASSPAMWLAMTTEMLHAADRLERLGGVRVPALVIVGEQDEPFIKPSERMAAAIPAAALAVIPHAGHSPQFEAPDAWWSAVTSFLAALPQPA